MSQPILEINDLNIAFSTYGQHTRILHDVTMHVDKGERVALIGQSGSGKTVTMRSIIGTLPMPPGIIESGQIKYQGSDLLTLSKTERGLLKGSGISIVLQDPLLSFNPVLTIHRQMDDIVRYADARMGQRRGKKERKQHILMTLRKVRLAEGERVLSSYPMMLSGGMRQRVLIGMALLNKPKLLIADEPGTALDVTTQEEILNLLNTLVDEEGLSLLLITHNLGVVREMGDRIYVMELGRIVEQGTRAQIFTNPSHPYTKKLMDSVPPLYGPNVVNFVNETPEAPKIEIADLTKDFVRKGGFFQQTKETNRAVDGVNLTVNKGDIFGIAGESGSGKTTVAKILLGLYEPTSGSIKIDKQPLEDMVGTTEFRKKVQIVYQNPGSSLNPKRTVADQLAVPLKFAGYNKEQIRQRVDELLRMVDLPASYAFMYPHELSGGQKQRIAIARALSVNPSILILDEPTSALDVLIQKNVIDLLRRLRTELDLTYVFISHDLSLMRNFCNRIAVMHRGKICEQGPTQQVFDTPAHPYTRALLSSIPVTSDREAQLKPKVTKAEKEAVLATSTAIMENA